MSDWVERGSAPYCTGQRAESQICKCILFQPGGKTIPILPFVYLKCTWLVVVDEGKTL